MGFSPNKLGSGYKDSKYLHIAVVSRIIVSSFNFNAGTLELGAMALYSGVLCSSFPRSKSIIFTWSNISFSFKKIRTFSGLGASLLEYSINIMPC